MSASTTKTKLECAVQEKGSNEEEVSNDTEKEETNSNKTKSQLAEKEKETGGNDKTSHSEESIPSFVVIYLGSAHLDRRFPPQSAMPWVMGEIKRSRDMFKEVCLQIHGNKLRGICYEGTEKMETAFEHNLHNLSRFAKTHQDPRCFAYLNRTSLYSDYECHAFLTNDESVVPEVFKCIRGAAQHDLFEEMEHKEPETDKVPEVFKCIRGAAQHDLFEEMEHKEPETDKACFEVMYVGRAKVKGKKIMSTHIDDLVLRLEAKEQLSKPVKEENGEDVLDRRRHKSDSSIKSLPSMLNSDLVKENELQKLSKKTIHQGVEWHNESPTGSNEDVTKGQGHLQGHCEEKTNSSDRLSEGHSSGENLTDGIHLSGSGDQLKDMFTALHEHPDSHGHSDLPNQGQGIGVHGNHSKSSNKIMLFRIGQHEISLISLDKKQTIIERKFKNISSVSQGNIKSDVFGFICREQNHQLVCHLLRGFTGELVDEIMLALRTSFQSAYQQSRLQTQQICINCPLHQYHKLCQDINGQAPESAYNILCKRIQQLPEKEATDLYHALQNENPQCFEESVEVLMIGIRKMCELRQKEHSHISDSNKGSHKCDFYLVDMKGKTGKSAFDNLRNKAKKTLTHSFESLLSNVQHKRDEMKEAFRTRSGTLESEGGSFSRSNEYSVGSTPDQSPAPSPAIPHKEVNFDFPSPPSSPSSRPRSSTIGAAPDSATLERVAARQEERQKAEQKEQEKRRASESPMKHMFILANAASSPRRRSSGNSSGPHDDASQSNDVSTPDHRGSWRQKIFNRVVTPAKHPASPTLDELEEDSNEPGKVRKKTSEELRALWKKAILETLLLIRMEKENLDLREIIHVFDRADRKRLVGRQKFKAVSTQRNAVMKGTLLVRFNKARPTMSKMLTPDRMARQDEVHLKRQKLDYVEITPCLKEVSRVWDEMLLTTDRPSVKFDNDKLLHCVREGVPQSKRGDIWWFLVEQHQLKHPELGKKVPEVEYTELLKQLTNHQHAILIDLGRTFPGHPYFSMQLGNGQLALFNLLKAYSLMDQDVGYCQGLSFVAGILLMHMEESLAFDAWIHVMYNLGLRKLYRPNMIALQIQLYQLTRLIHDNYKDLYDHFETHEIAPTLYAAPWFLTLFASQFPLGFVARVFDLIFIQGTDVIFKVALALLGNHKELIIQCNSFETIVEFIKTTLPEMGMIQMERVINQVFDMDIAKSLQSYEVEYHVLKEEMIYSPQRGESGLIEKLERDNHSLKQQNAELLEKLQQAQSHERSLQSMIHKFQTQENKLKSHIQTLELERSALLNAVTKLKQRLPESDQVSLDLSLPPLTPSMPVSPMRQGVQITSPSENSAINNLKVDKTKSARFRPSPDS